MAPDPRLAPGGMAEVRTAVAALAEAGIGTILDVVLNHSGEGDAQGPTLSLRGLGDAAWYRTDAQGRYVNDTGCGHALALDRPWPLRLAMDAMRHWVTQAGLAGLRLDLATTLGDAMRASIPTRRSCRRCGQDPVLRDCWIIAEPWDVGQHGHRLGAFAPGWGEWNDRFRDGIRRFWRGDAGSLARPRRAWPDRATFFARAPRPTASTSSPRMMASPSPTWSATRTSTMPRMARTIATAPTTTSPGTMASRARRMTPGSSRAAARMSRALFALLLAARGGTPMLSMGDEAGRTQHGNNNAWCQDNATSWFDWSAADQELIDFTARLVAARRTHPALGSAAPLTGAADAAGQHDVQWLRLDGASMRDTDWNDPTARSVAMLLHAAGEHALIVLHGSADASTLTLPTGSWRLCADSADPARRGEVRHSCQLAPRSVAWFTRVTGSSRQVAADSSLLATLATAAGIATAWHDIDGRRHAVPEGTLRGLLAALNLPAETAAQARDSLARRRAAALRAAPHIGSCHDLPDGRRFGIAAQAFALRHARDQASATSPPSPNSHALPRRAARRWSGSARRTR